MQSNWLELAICIAATALSQGTAAALDGAAAVRSLAAIVVAGSWLIGLPMSALLAFGPLDLGLSGLWLGLASGEAAKAVMAGLLLIRFDWLQAAAAARERSEVTEMGPCPETCHPPDDSASTS